MRRILLALALACAAASGAHAQARTIKLVVPYPPGGTADIVARLLGDQIGRSGGPSVVIENRPGANTIVGAEAVARAAPDGNTVGMISPEFIVNPHLRKPNYDPVTSFEPVCRLVSSPTVIIVNAASPHRTLKDLIDAARAKPGDVTMASTGIFQIPIEQLKRAANVNFTYVPFQGNAPASNALLGDHVTSVFSVYPTVAELIKSGKVRALGIASRKRIDALPDVPTIIESGYADYEVEVWLGLVAPAKTDLLAVAHIADLFTNALLSGDVKAKLAGQDSYPSIVCGPEFAAALKKQYDDVGRTVRESNIKAD